MITGRVKWFDSAKGFGFLVPDVGGTDVFVHIRAVTEGVELRESQRVEFEEVPSRGSRARLKLRGCG
jgi:cold shock protein